MMETDKSIRSRIRFGRLRLIYRWSVFFIISFARGDFDYLRNSLNALLLMIAFSVKDLFLKNVKCNICNWQGAQFYPNVGPGYFEVNTTCPNCLCQDRHRSLIYVLEKSTDFFSPNKTVIEVAPMRSFEQYCRETKNTGGYVSFDYERYAMEKGDITAMHYKDNCCDFFLCLHVLEHIKDEKKALSEIFRVLSAGGYAVFQVPIDSSLQETINYDEPRRREAWHVRRYGKDFSNRLESFGFKTREVSVADLCLGDQIKRFGLSIDPFYISVKK